MATHKEIQAAGKRRQAEELLGYVDALTAMEVELRQATGFTDAQSLMHLKAGLTTMARDRSWEAFLLEREAPCTTD